MTSGDLAMSYRRVVYGYPRERLPDDLGLDGSWPDHVDVAIEDESTGASEASMPAKTQYLQWTPDGLVSVDGPLPGRMI